jgi:DNA-binding CsgD family transcriptional regulator
MATGKAGAQQKIAATERRRKALELRKGGASLRSIADALGVAVGTVHNDVNHELATLAAETRQEAEQLRALELARLDAVMLGHWQAATRGDVDAARIVLRCIEQRVKLLGLAMGPEAAASITLTHIELRWSDGRTILDVTPPAGDHAAAAPRLAGDGSGAPGALQGAGSGSALGQVAVSWGVMPRSGGEGRAGLVGGAELPPELDGVA